MHYSHGLQKGFPGSYPPETGLSSLGIILFSVERCLVEAFWTWNKGCGPSRASWLRVPEVGSSSDDYEKHIYIYVYIHISIYILYIIAYIYIYTYKYLHLPKMDERLLAQLPSDHFELLVWRAMTRGLQDAAPPASKNNLIESNLISYNMMYYNAT